MPFSCPKIFIYTQLLETNDAKTWSDTEGCAYYNSKIIDIYREIEAVKT